MAMIDESMLTWSWLAKKHGGNFRSRRHETAKIMNGFEQDMKKIALRSVSENQIDEFEYRLGLTTPRTTKKLKARDEADAKRKKREAQLAAGELVSNDSISGSQDGMNNNSNNQNSPTSGSSGSAGGPASRLNNSAKAEFLRRPNAELQWYDYGSISSQPRSVYCHTIMHGKCKDMDRNSVKSHENRCKSWKRMYTGNVNPGLSTSSWNRQDSLLLPSNLSLINRSPDVVRYYCGSAHLHHKHMINPVSHGRYKNLTASAMGNALLQREDSDHTMLNTNANGSNSSINAKGNSNATNNNSTLNRSSISVPNLGVTSTRATDLRRIRNSQCLDFLALDEVLVSRAQWQGHKWSDFTDPWRKYSIVPSNLGSAPVRRFEEICEVGFRQNPVFDPETDEPGGEPLSNLGHIGNWHSMETIYPTNYLPKPDALKRSWHDEKDDPSIAIPGAINQHQINVNGNGNLNANGQTGSSVTTITDNGSLNPPSDEILDNPNLVPPGYKLIRQNGAAVATNQYHMDTNSLSSSSNLNGASDALIIPDYGSIIHPKFRPIFVRLYKLCHIGCGQSYNYKTDVVKFFKSFTKDETHVHGLLAVDRFHIALYKLGILSPDSNWDFKNSMEFCYYLRKFSSLIDGGPFDEGLVDLRLMNKLALHVGKEEKRNIELYEIEANKLAAASKSNTSGVDNVGMVVRSMGKGKIGQKGSTNAMSSENNNDHHNGTGYSPCSLRVVDYILDKEKLRKEREQRKLNKESQINIALRDKDELFLRTVAGTLGGLSPSSNMSPKMEHFHRLTSVPGQHNIIQQDHSQHQQQNLNQNSHSMSHSMTTSEQLTAPASNTHLDRMEAVKNFDKNDRNDPSYGIHGQNQNNKNSPNSKSKSNNKNNNNNIPVHPSAQTFMGTGTFLAGTGLAPGLAAAATARGSVAELGTVTLLQTEDNLNHQIRYGKK